MADNHQVEETASSEAPEEPAAAPAATPADETGNGSESTLVDVEAQLEELKAQAAEYLDGWQRARAELANYRKRTEREREQWAGTLRGEVILKLLPVLDDFDRAVGSLPEDGPAKEWAEGIALIYRKLQTQLTEMGVQEIEALGKPFNPEQQEAVMQREDTGCEAGEVVEVLRKGYLIDGRVLRPAMVVVAA